MQRSLVIKSLGGIALMQTCRHWQITRVTGLQYLSMSLLPRDKHSEFHQHIIRSQSNRSADISA